MWCKRAIRSPRLPWHPAAPSGLETAGTPSRGHGLPRRRQKRNGVRFFSFLAFEPRAMSDREAFDPCRHAWEGMKNRFAVGAL
jgi:hypothetical protein